MHKAPSVNEMLEEVVDLSTGLGVMLLPVLVLAMPGILLVVVPAIVLLVPMVLAGAALAVPYLLVRAVRRPWRRDTYTKAPSAAPAGGPAT